MPGKSFATILGFVGGLSVVAGGLLRFLVFTPRAISSGAVSPLLTPLAPLLGAIVLGGLVVWACRPRFWWWPGRRLFNGILLVVLGAAVWILLGASILFLVGGLLAILAGILLPIEGMLLRHARPRRLLARRLV